SVEVQAYDAAKKIEGLEVTADVMRFQADGNQIQGVRLFAVDNNSKPPRTQMNDQNFEFYLPEGAQIDTSLAKTAGGQPVNSPPVPQKDKNRFAFIFPLRPGETQFQVVFHLPYTGSLSVDPKPLYPAQHFVVMLPKSMQFSAEGEGFQSMDDPQQSSAVVQVASNTKLGQHLAFKVSGTGTLPDGDSQGGGNGQVGGAQVSGPQDRPGGGLGPPIDAPDPLDKYRWYFLGGFAVILAGGAIYISGRSRTASVADGSDAEMELPESLAPLKTTGAKVSVPTAAPAASKANLLLEALKEELFQLELDHKRGSISQQEYEKAKSALDQTLERALKRETQKT
ncbi:MAG TPA: hypothetical protein VJQ82_05185, partial [Terriglobales bacterium]|nr:hypothetical protein [Terriglobales bacterium]